MNSIGEYFVYASFSCGIAFPPSHQQTITLMSLNLNSGSKVQLVLRTLESAQTTRKPAQIRNHEGPIVF